MQPKIQIPIKGEDMQPKIQIPINGYLYNVWCYIDEGEYDEGGRWYQYRHLVFVFEGIDTDFTREITIAGEDPEYIYTAQDFVAELNNIQQNPNHPSARFPKKG